MEENNMKITDVKVANVRGNFLWPLIKVETDEGIYGYGESRDYSPRLEYALPMKDLILHLKKQLIGQDPTNVESLFDKIRRYGSDGRFGGSVSGIEMALWDITGKAFGLPIYKLIGGGYRDKVRIYCDCHTGKPIADAATDYEVKDAEDFYTPEAYAKAAKKIKALGFTILKFDLHPGYVKDGMIGNFLTRKGLKYQTSVVKALRDAVGEDFPLALDCGQGTVRGAIRFGKAVDDFGLAWIEDLIDWKDVEGFKRVTEAVKTPTLTGENVYTTAHFKNLIQSRAVDIVAPDMATHGGIMENKKVAWLAKLNGLSIAPHFAGSPVSMMANIHAAASMPNNLIAVEFHAVAVPWWQDLVKGVKKPIIDEGYLEVPNKPGLGIELEEKSVRKHLAEGENYFE
jgi:L-alanine-DL-glutamate epimerase-like enolase superfamily enzyme